MLQVNNYSVEAEIFFEDLISLFSSAVYGKSINEIKSTTNF